MLLLLERRSARPMGRKAREGLYSVSLYFASLGQKAAKKCNFQQILKVERKLESCPGQFPQSRKTVMCVCLKVGDLCPFPLTDQGHILHARENPWCMFTCQISFGCMHVFIYEGINSAKIWQFWPNFQLFTLFCQLSPILHARLDPQCMLLCHISVHLDQCILLPCGAYKLTAENQMIFNNFEALRAAVGIPIDQSGPNSECLTQILESRFLDGDIRFKTSWWRGLVGRMPASAGALSRSHAWLLVRRVTVSRVKHPLSVSQLGQLSLPSLRGR